MRALHLIDPAGPGGGPCTLRLVADVLAGAPAERHAVLIIGNGRHMALARRCGLRPRGLVRAPLNRAGMALRTLRGLLRCDERAGAPYDLLHAWTLTSAVAALRAGGRRVVVTAVTGAPLRTADRRKLRRAEVLALGTGAARSLKLAGVGFSGLLPGAVAPETVDMEQRSALRAQWGADATSFVIGLLGDPPTSADGDFAINAAGRAALAGRDIRIIVHHASASPAGLRGRMKQLDLGHMVVLDDRMAEPWSVVAGLDAAFHAPRTRGLAHGPGPWRLPGLSERAGTPATSLPLTWAMAARLPIIAAESDAVMELIEDGSSGVLYPAGVVNAASALVLDLFDDAALCRRIGAAAGQRAARMPPGALTALIADTYYGTKRGAAALQRAEGKDPGAAPRRRETEPGSLSSSVAAS